MLKLIVRISIGIKWFILRIRTEKRLLFVLILSALPLGLICMEGTEKNCRVYTTSNVHIADCSLLEMAVNVPNNLDPGIEVMNLSGNHLTNISDKSFERYKHNLVALDLSNMTHFKSGNVTYDDRSFIGLRKLEFLDISHSCIARHQFRFPSSLRVLKIERCELTSLNFSHIRDLEELHAASCNLIDLPLIYKQAPLKYLDLRSNNLSKLRLESISPFCQLKYLHLKIPEGEGLHSPKTYCQCMIIESWLTNTGVKHAKLNCTKDKSKIPPKPNITSEFSASHFISAFSVRKSETENITLDLHPLDTARTSNCSSRPSEKAMQNRKDCIDKLSNTTITPVETNWYLIGAVLLAIFLLLIPSFVYTRLRLRQKRKSRTEEVYDEPYIEEAEEETYPEYHHGHNYDDFNYEPYYYYHQ